ncbi:MAG: L,D-transpeptidase family protein [Bacteroidaceae bacterium]|nr:L,D-transpeptidase family protein [Bacteroidaceae bacterium]
MRRRPAAILFLFVILVAACGRGKFRRVQSLADLRDWIRPEYVLDANKVQQEIERTAAASWGEMYADAYVRAYYKEEGHPMVWATRMGIDERADTLLHYLAGAEAIGFRREAFHVDTIRSLLDEIRLKAFDREDASSMMGRLEYLLTHAFLRYACGQRFGYVHPRRVMNHLLEDAPAAGEEQHAVTYRQLYDHRSEEVTDSFVRHALEEVRHHRIGAFLEEIQPTDTLYRRMQREYWQALERGDTSRTRLARINMERARWRYPHPDGGRYIWVNLAGQELTAVDTERDTMTTMRVCCGNLTHKTPLLHSRISHVELNPYWVIPQSIVRKEIMPRHVGDSAYYARNRYRAINKETKAVVNPARLSADQLRSGLYTLRQDNGAGNSLGRIIFRFPNNFSVYLHDTSNKGAFHSASRAISHGCVRVERPLDLALFFLDKPTPLFTDRIRMAIDQPPLSEEGRRYQEANPEGRKLGGFNYDRPVPVWLDYWTLYPNPKGALLSYPDSYGYDGVIEKKLNAL